MLLRCGLTLDVKLISKIFFVPDVSWKIIQLVGAASMNKRSGRVFFLTSYGEGKNDATIVAVTVE